MKELLVNEKDIRKDKLKKDFYYAYNKRFSLKKVRMAVRTILRMLSLDTLKVIDWDMIDKFENEYYVNDLSFEDMKKQYGLELKVK